MLIALEKSNNLYAYSYLERDGEIVDIQMFTLDIENSKYYVYEIFSR